MWRRRPILGPGDQVGYERPEENIRGMIEVGRRLSVSAQNTL